MCRAVPAASDALALVLLCIQRGSPEQAVAVLNSLSHSSLTNLLSDNPALLLEQQCPAVTEASSTDSRTVCSPLRSTSNTRAVSSRRENVCSFSELASVLMDSKPAVLADVLAGLVTVSQFATLQQILQVMENNFAVLFQSNSKVVMLKSLSEYEYIALWVI